MAGLRGGAPPASVTKALQSCAIADPMKATDTDRQPTPVSDRDEKQVAPVGLRDFLASLLVNQYARLAASCLPVREAPHQGTTNDQADSLVETVGGIGVLAHDGVDNTLGDEQRHEDHD